MRFLRERKNVVSPNLTRAIEWRARWQLPILWLLLGHIVADLSPRGILIDHFCSFGAPS